MKILENIFYQLYVWFGQFFHNDDEPANSAWLALTFLIYADILGVVWLVEGVLGKPFFEGDSDNRLVTVGAFVLFMIVTYFYWYRRPIREKIFAKQASSSPEAKDFNKKLAVGFIVFSIIFPVFSMIVSAELLRESVPVVTSQSIAANRL